MSHIKNLVLLFLFFLFFQAKSQNLVPNPGFENTISLSCGYINYPSEFTSTVYNWIMPSGGTSDIFSTLTAPYCALSAFSTNYYTRGVQVPRTGTTMAGFFTYGVDGYPDYREYLEVELISPLAIGKTYYVEMYVSASDRMMYATNNIGMYFSTDLVDLPGTYTTLSYTPQVKSNSIITDTINWVKISGTFTATTAAQYLLIGNFYDNANTATLVKNNNTASIAIGAYYYVDDVLVKEICTPKDSSITLCKGNTVTLSSDENTIVSWALESAPNTVISTDPELDVSPQVTTRYIATYACGETSVFEVIVRAQPTYTLGKDTTLCAGETLSFNAATDDGDYTWQDGSTNPVYTITHPGNYSVTITNSCGTLTDAIAVTPCCTEGIIPNLITPNADGKNDTFDIGCLGNGDYELIIYNIWGAKVYQNPAYRNDWGGSNVSDGVYYYAIKDKTKTIYHVWVEVLR